MMLAYPSAPYEKTWHCRYYPVPKDSILFIDKVYPKCSSCTHRYLQKLGCLWCKKYKPNT